MKEFGLPINSKHACKKITFFTIIGQAHIRNLAIIAPFNGANMANNLIVKTT